MKLTVKRIGHSDFEVTGEKVQSKVWYINSYRSNKVNGKGSRNFKNEILKAVEDFISLEIQTEKKQYEQEQQELKEQFQQSQDYKELDLLTLYEVVTMDAEYNSHHYRKNERLLTGIEIREDFYNVIEMKDHKINNTDIYCLGTDSHYSSKATIDNRFIVIGLAKSVYVTGLTLKELLFTGLKTYKNVHKAKYTELDVVLGYGKSGNRAVLLTDFTSKDSKIGVSERVQLELARAENEVFKAPEERYTNDKRPIDRAWFSSKPMTFEEIEEKDCATFDEYVIIESIELNKDNFELFKKTLDMKMLNIEFTGGADSTFQGLSNTEDYFANTEEEQQQFNEGSYRLVLKVTSKDCNYSLLIDPQGYDYARYVALID